MASRIIQENWGRDCPDIDKINIRHAAVDGAGRPEYRQLHLEGWENGNPRNVHPCKDENEYPWSSPDSGLGWPVRRYRYPTLGSGRAAFVRARADPLACNLNNDMVLLWNDVAIEDSGAPSGNPPSEESIEDAYERLFTAAARHREDLLATLRDAGLERVNQLFADSLSAKSDPPDVVNHEECLGTRTHDASTGDDDDDAGDDGFDDSGVRGSLELLNDDQGFVDLDESLGAQDVYTDRAEQLPPGVMDSVDSSSAHPKVDDALGDSGFERDRDTDADCARHTSLERGSRCLDENILVDSSGVINNSNSNNNASGNSAPGISTSLGSHNSSRFDSGLYDSSSCSDNDDQIMLERPGNAGRTGMGSIREGDVITESKKTFNDEYCDAEVGVHEKFGTADSFQPRDNLERRHIKEEYPEVFLEDRRGKDRQEQHSFSDTNSRHYLRHDIAHISQHKNGPQPSPGFSYPSPSHSPIVSSDHFHGQSRQGSPTLHTTDFFSSSPIPAQSGRKHPPGSITITSQPSGPHDHPTHLLAPLAADSSQLDWSELSILPLVTSPHHHELPVRDAPAPLSPTLVQCHAPDCGKTVRVDIAHHPLKNFHNGQDTFYCCRGCRSRDRQHHGSRVSSASNHLVQFCSFSPDVKAALSRLARRGFLSSGRGCVMLGFPDLCAAEEFLCYGLKPRVGGMAGGIDVKHGLELLPVYVSLRELEGSKMYGGGDVLDRLLTLCESYNPDFKFVLNIGIGVRWNRERKAEDLTFPQVSRFRPQASEGDRGWSVTMNSTQGKGYVLSPGEISPPSRNLQRPRSSKSHRRGESNSRGRSTSFGSEDVGYGSLSDVREGFSHSPLSPSHPVTNSTDAVFQSMSCLPSPPFPSPLSPPCAAEAVVYYCESEPRLKCPIVQKCACLRLYNPAFHPPSPTHPASLPLTTAIQKDLPGQLPKTTDQSPYVWRRRCGPTLILTDTPGSWYEAQDEFRQARPCTEGHEVDGDFEESRRAVQRKARELCFANVQLRLRQRGVDLQHQFPDVYAELVDFVTGDAEHFPSRIIFPVDQHGKGRMFTCVLMPEAEPNLRWTQSAKLLENLDISKERVWGPFMSSASSRVSQPSLFHQHRNMEKVEDVDLDHAKIPQVGNKQFRPVDENLSENKEYLFQREKQDVSNKDDHMTPADQEKPELEHKNSFDEYATSQANFRVCPRCHTKLILVDRSTQTGHPETAGHGELDTSEVTQTVNVNEIKRNLTVPDLIKHCPTSPHVRRKFNTNFPIFSFDPDILEMLTSWAKSQAHCSVTRKTMSPYLLGHLACSSLLLQYQKPQALGGNDVKLSQCPFSHGGNNNSTGSSIAVKSRRPVSGSDKPKDILVHAAHQSHKLSRLEKKPKANHKFSRSPGLNHQNHQTPDSTAKGSPAGPKVTFSETFATREPPAAYPVNDSLPTPDHVTRILSEWKGEGRQAGTGSTDPHCVHTETLWTCDFSCETDPKHFQYNLGHSSSLSQTYQTANRPQNKANTSSSSHLLRHDRNNISIKTSNNHHGLSPCRQSTQHRSRRKRREKEYSENLQSDW